MYNKDLDLDQLLADPLVRMMMSSDGVEETHIRQLAKRIAPRHTASRAAAGWPLGDAGPTIRHAPSCRWGRPSEPPHQRVV
jgi:hypothetical protein